MSEVILLVVGAVLGLVASQGNEWLRLRREEQRAIGRSLKTLMLVRRYLDSIKRIKELITEYYNPPSQQLVQFQLIMQSFILPSTVGLSGKYEEAIDVISGVKPVLGLRIARKTELVPMIMRLTQLMSLDEQASTVWLKMEMHISDLPSLDDLILELAELHSIDLRHEVRRELEEPLKLPSDIDGFLKEHARAIQKSGATEK